VYYTQTVTAYIEGTTIRMTQTAPRYTLTTELTPAAGTALESLETDGASAVACFTALGTAEPCVRIEAVQDSATIAQTDDGAISITGERPGRLDVLVTALTAGRASVGLGLLDPADVADAEDVEAAILDGTDPAYASRAERLGRLGFEEAATFGAYRVLLRSVSP